MFQFNYDRTYFIQSVPFVSNGLHRIYGYFAQSHDYVFAIGSSLLYRLRVTNITDMNTMSFPYLISSRSFQIALDPSRDLGHAISGLSSEAIVFDPIEMVVLLSFNYTLGGPFAGWNSPTPGGWALVVDQARHLLYIGVNCASPTPGIIWQYDVSDIDNITLRNWVNWGSDPCWEEGFVEVADGRAWFYEDDAGWVGGFVVEDLNYGRHWALPPQTMLKRSSTTRSPIPRTGSTPRTMTSQRPDFVRS